MTDTPTPDTPAVPEPVAINEIVRLATDELVAHGEFSAYPHRNRPNAEVAARAVVAIAQSFFTDRLAECEGERDAFSGRLHDEADKIAALVDRATTAEAALTAAGVRPRVKHNKRGTTYEIIGTGKMQADDWEDMTDAFDEGGYVGGGSVDMREVVIYRSESDGSLWVRPVEEFNDGRFSALTTEGE